MSAPQSTLVTCTNDPRGDERDARTFERATWLDDVIIVSILSLCV